MKFKNLKLASALALLISPVLAHADNLLGFDLGINFSTMTNFSNNVSGNSEFVGGAFVDWALSDIWYASTGLRYNSYGVSQTVGSVSASVDAHYLELPLLIKAKFDARAFHPYVMAGPNLGFKVGEGGSVTSSTVSVSGSTNNFNTVNFSMDFGAGAEFPVTEDVRGFLQFEYALGLVNTLKNASANSTSQTRGAMIAAGLATSF